jgi:hypothetical protein
MNTFLNLLTRALVRWMSVNNDISMARDRMLKNRLSFVIIKNGKIIYESKSQGLMSLIKAVELNQGKLEGAALADKVVGRAALLLAAKAKIAAIYARLLSVQAFELASTFSMSLIYEKTTKRILNRRKDNVCPFEKVVGNTKDPEKAFRLLKKCKEYQGNQQIS